MGKPIKLYEDFLLKWQPAIGTPGSAHHAAPHEEAFAMHGLDSNFHSYHREALEVLHPLILDGEEECIFVPHFVLLLEAMLVYRNHLLLQGFKSAVLVENLRHDRGVNTCDLLSSLEQYHH